MQACLKSGSTAPQTEQLCGSRGCSRDGDCMGAGTCNSATATCDCAPGFAGPTCIISLGPCNGTDARSSKALQTSFCCSTGVLDRQGACCTSGVSLPRSFCVLLRDKELPRPASHASQKCQPCLIALMGAGVVSETGMCCTGGNATLDSSGACCNGQLDACGACNGTGQVVDLTGSCCPGKQDAGGLCCPPPSTVDEFGVCGGRSNSGISVLNLKLLSNHTSGKRLRFMDEVS